MSSWQAVICSSSSRTILNSLALASVPRLLAGAAVTRINCTKETTMSLTRVFISGTSKFHHLATSNAIGAMMTMREVLNICDFQYIKTYQCSVLKGDKMRLQPTVPSHMRVLIKPLTTTIVGKGWCRNRLHSIIIRSLTSATTTSKLCPGRAVTRAEDKCFTFRGIRMQ